VEYARVSNKNNIERHKTRTIKKENEKVGARAFVCVDIIYFS
jgi:hypothetical protein